MSNPKWADVAHMYIKSGIEVEYPCESKKSGKRRAILTGVTLDEMETTYRRKERGSGGGLLRGDLLGWKPNGYHDTDALHTKPILRHLEDMAEAEALEILNMLYSMPLDGCLVSPRESLNDKRGTKAGIVSHLDISVGEPRVWLYLLANGFDLFGLIESGQAIRAEKPSDGSTQA